MPLQKLELRPGINRESTNYANEGGYFACDKVRFRSGFPEKIGGWINQSTNTFKGVCRSLFNWVSFASENLLGIGTNQKFYVELFGVYHDITPLQYSETLPNNPFLTTNGSYLVTVTTATPHSLAVGTWVTFSGVSGGGIVNNIVLNGNFEIITTPSATTFTIIGATLANATTVGGGAAVLAAYEINAGNATFSLGLGWGGGPWGFGGWGIGSTISSQIRLWSQDNNNENLLFNPRSGPIYYWAKDTSTWARAITLNAYSNTEVKHTTAASFILGATTITVTDPTNITSGSVVSGTGIPAGTFVTTAYVFGSTSVPISAATTAGSSGNYTFSYAGRHVPNNTYQVSTSSTGNFCIAFGSNPYNPTNFSETFDPLLVRWSDADNPFEWVPATTNQAGESRLSYGSYVVNAVDTRQEILIWTDAALFSMQYLGPPYVWGFNLLMENVSIASPNASITINNVTYWMGVDKFYQYSGRVETLPCSLRQFIFTNINTDQLAQVCCGANEGYNEIWWFYPTANSLVNNRYVVYNYLERIWYYGILDRGFWLDSPLRQYPMAAFSVQNSYVAPNTIPITAMTGNGVTATASFSLQVAAPTVGVFFSISGATAAGFNGNYQVLSSTTTSVTFLNTTAGSASVLGNISLPLSSAATVIPVINASSYPETGVVMIELEQVFYTGKTSTSFTGCIRGYNGTTAAGHTSYTPITYNVPNQVMNHEFGNDDRSLTTALPIEAYVETSDFDIQDGQSFGYVWRMLPDLTFNNSSNNNPAVTMTVKARQNSGSNYAAADQPTVQQTATIPIEQYTGQIYTRVRGRQMSFRIDSTDYGVAWQLGAMRIDVRPDGRR